MGDYGRQTRELAGSRPLIMCGAGAVCVRVKG